MATNHPVRAPRHAPPPVGRNLLERKLAERARAVLQEKIGYVGERNEDGKHHGQGTRTFADGAKYEGGFKDDKRHGRGTYTFADGAKYEGEWENGKYHGQGTRTFADGAKYEGEWKNNKFHGRGTHTSSSGEKRVGEWEDGELLPNAVAPPEGGGAESAAAAASSDTNEATEANERGADEEEEEEEEEEEKGGEVKPDAEKVLQLWGDKLPNNSREDNFELLHAAAYYLMGESGILGAIVMATPARDVWIKALAVSPQLKGYGRLLVTHAKRNLDPQKKVYVQADNTALEFYRKQGFDDAVYKINADECTSMVATCGNPDLDLPPGLSIVCHRFTAEDTAMLPAPEEEEEEEEDERKKKEKKEDDELEKQRKKKDDEVEKKRKKLIDERKKEDADIAERKKKDDEVEKKRKKLIDERKKKNDELEKQRKKDDDELEKQRKKEDDELEKKRKKKEKKEDDELEKKRKKLIDERKKKDDEVEASVDDAGSESNSASNLAREGGADSKERPPPTARKGKANGETTKTMTKGNRNNRHSDKRKANHSKTTDQRRIKWGYVDIHGVDKIEGETRSCAQDAVGNGLTRLGISVPIKVIYSECKPLKTSDTPLASVFEAPSVEKVVTFEHVEGLHQMKGGPEFNVLQMVDSGVFFIAAEIPTYFYETNNHCLIYDSGYRDETRPECVGALIDNRKNGAVRLLDASDRKSAKDSRNALSSFYGDKKVFFKQVYRMAPKISQPEPDKKRKRGGGGAKNPEIEDPWAKRSRYDRRQPGARLLSWDGYKPEKNPEIHGVQLRDLSADAWRMHCCICKKPFTGGGHNPRGFTSKYKSGSKYGESHNRCCGKCNVLVEQRRGEK